MLEVSFLLPCSLAFKPVQFRRHDVAPHAPGLLVSCWPVFGVSVSLLIPIHERDRDELLMGLLASFLNLNLLIDARRMGARRKLRGTPPHCVRSAPVFGAPSSNDVRACRQSFQQQRLAPSPLLRPAESISKLRPGQWQRGGNAYHQPDTSLLPTVPVSMSCPLLILVFVVVQYRHREDAFATLVPGKTAIPVQRLLKAAQQRIQPLCLPLPLMTRQYGERCLLMLHRCDGVGEDALRVQQGDRLSIAAAGDHILFAQVNGV